MRSKLPGINLELTAKEDGVWRRERGAGRRCRRGTGSPGRRVELQKNKGKEERVERGTDASLLKRF